MEITPPQPQFTLEEDVPTKIIKEEVIVEKEVEKIVDRIIEKPVIVEREKLIQVPDLKTEEFYKLIYDIGSKIQDIKNEIKESSAQVIVSTRENQELKKLNNSILKLEKIVENSIKSILPDQYKNIESVRKMLLAFGARSWQADLTAQAITEAISRLDEPDQKQQSPQQ